MGQIEELYQIFGLSDEEGLAKLKEQMAAEKKLYESFENTSIYVIPGVESGSYIAYIETQAWFRKIQTPAPVLLRAYIVKTDEGLRMKTDEMLNEAETAAVKAAEGSEAVKKMNNDYRTALAKAIVSDAKLGSLYQKLRAGGGAAAAADAEEEESTEAVTDAVIEIPGRAGTESAETSAESAAPAETAAETGAAASEGTEG